MKLWSPAPDAERLWQSVRVLGGFHPYSTGSSFWHFLVGAPQRLVFPQPGTNGALRYLIAAKVNKEENLAKRESV